MIAHRPLAARSTAAENSIVPRRVFNSDYPHLLILTVGILRFTVDFLPVTADIGQLTNDTAAVTGDIGSLPMSFQRYTR
ncbi:hypothetical protein [Sporolactobacillus sp. KGMB 08714]|uniref:hypothetical protein n=1 Tax=Sporolactobacillus sp. KGMB 08714 TaxID=3064704 RepID=UPI002FBE68D0